MNFTSASLPFAHKKFSNNRRVGFEERRGRWSRFKDKVVELIQTAIRAPTGSPSDGLGADGTESSTSTSVFIAAQKLLSAEKDGEDWEINETVINGENPELLRNERDSGSPFRSDSGGGSISRHSGENGDSNYAYHPPSLRTKLHWLTMQINSFFNQKFDDPQTELDFRKLRWYSTKAWAFYGSLFLVLNWVLYLILNLESTSKTLYGQILYYGGLTFVTVPVPFMVATDMPFRHRIIFQVWVTFAVWYCGLSETVEMRVCHFFVRPNTCFRKDFLANMYYTTALPSIMMIVMTDRLYNAIVQVIQLVLLLAFIIPVQGIYARNVVSFVIFSIFSQGLHYNREITERRLYLLNTQLKMAYKAQQKAQAAQFKASQAKRRFASYIFHEVRVPLHNAAIAFNNMTTDETFQDFAQKDQGITEDIAALDVSLATVQQVLNDSLDLEKMDAGHFDINPRPFNLHRVIRSTLGPIAVAAAAKNLDLQINFDERIDQLRPPTDPTSSTSGKNSQGTWVVGDEVRLRQILTNLASNAVKFTPEGTRPGITINTTFVSHRRSTSRHTSGAVDQEEKAFPIDKVVEDFEKGNLSDRGGEEKKETFQSQDVLVFRLDISDNGPGIKPSDLVDNQLFQPFAQTKVGRLSKNSTGLGLAIVRQIVSLSGGKLGVNSRRGKGATFWIELFYPLAKSSEIQAAILQEDRLTTSAFATAATIHEVQRWPVVAFAEDVKPPMLSGAVSHQPSHPLPPSPPPPPLPPPHPPSFSFSPPSDASFIAPSLSRLGSDAPLLDKPRVSEGTNTGNEKLHQIQETPKPSKAEVSAAPENKDIDDDGPLVVLVVDDNLITRSTMTRSLQKKGCIVYTAQDGKECLDLVLGPDARTYDLISLDNDMPVMTGEDAVKAMREAGRHDVFVVGCTGNALTDDQKRYLDAGADDILIKPINFNRLPEIMETARQRRRQRRTAKSTKS
ncbi:uncharacterized protein C8R40DRAFT_666463 [Lentinula edodes]|uniref:uncharacterized protein n=1 Tax=Lentinula edodes TaxID=5353 RepID=UPI001E8DF6A1|nr:uncharacterized protein C8R40DRAFT_666463 [Lentinula edodes]KAH7870098.1 hypothetical protein C8R40DRAFT_666463 [Lentinula edodes]